jgi:small conductance mechanosensitive channel
MTLTAADPALTSDFWNGVDAFFASFPGRLVHAAIIVVVAVLIAWVVRMVIRHTVHRIVNRVKDRNSVETTQALAVSPVASLRVVQRTRTLGNVLSNIDNVVVTVIAIILVIQVLSPGVLGSLAILTAAVGAGLGFGAQNIVKDILNGMFLVVEDQLGVGDVVDTGFATGVVENVGIRVTQVRDVNGTLWYVRNGEMVRIGNMSQGWARVILDLAVPYDTDVDAVQDRLLETARKLADDPRWRTRIVEQPELWGIQSISGEAIVLRVVMKTRTTAKDDVARELRSRIKVELDDMDVRLPALNTVVLQGFDHAASVTGANPPRTKPVATVTTEGAKPVRAPRSRKAAAPKAAPTEPNPDNTAGAGDGAEKGTDE